MNTVNVQNKIIREIENIPKEKLMDVYNMVHHFRLKLKSKPKEGAQNLLGDEFAGKWFGEESADEIIDGIRTNRANRQTEIIL